MKVTTGNKNHMSKLVDPAGINLASLNGTNGFVISQINSTQAVNAIGASVSSLGDINDDGVDDIIVSAGGDAKSDGKAYIIYGTKGIFNSTIYIPDNLNGSNGFVLQGTTSGFGSSVSQAGDINGDGINDILIGDPSALNSAGQTYVVFGNKNGFSSLFDIISLNGTNGFAINGISPGDMIGGEISGVGDVNGDGVGDIIIGAPWAGQSYVVFGSKSGFGATFDLLNLNGSNGYTVNDIHTSPPDMIGDYVVGPGDINGDGLNDVLLSGININQVYAIFGSTTNLAVFSLPSLNGTNGFTIDNVNYVGSAGDINNDGIDDIVVMELATNNKGYVIFGSSSFASSFNINSLNGNNGFSINPVNQNTSYQMASKAGDVNGDGIDDLVIGGKYRTNSIAQDYLVFGSNSGFSTAFNLTDLNGANGYAVNSVSPGDEACIVNGAGDVNGDGVDDILIGAPNAGKAYVVFGSKNPGPFPSNTPSPSPSATIAPSVTSSNTPTPSVTPNPGAFINLANLNGANGFKISTTESFYSVSVNEAGDVNGDGIADIIIGSFYAMSNAGQSYVIFGSKAGFSANFDLNSIDGTNGFAINGINNGDKSGYSVSGAGDVNGDGIDDIIIGAPLAGVNYAGQSYVVFGSKNTFSPVIYLAGLNGSNGFTINGIGGQSGSSVSGAGDVNGDGIDDVIIGAPGAVQSYVVYGRKTAFAPSISLSALDGSNGFTINGVSNSVACGFSVGGIGDVNGDGIDDIIIGDPFFESNDLGQSYVVFGNRLGFSSQFYLDRLSGSNGFIISGTDPEGESGVSVSGAGDINGDGIADLIIAGSKPCVVFGSKNNFDKILYIDALNGQNGFIMNSTHGGAGSVHSAGDINNDGIADIILGSSSGYVVYGSRSGFNPVFNLGNLNSFNGFTVYGFTSISSVSGAGDVNGDGIDDIIVGMSGDGPGFSYVVFGTSHAGPSASVTPRPNSPTPSPTLSFGASPYPTDDPHNAPAVESNVGAIAGGVVGGIVGVAALGFAAWWAYNKGYFNHIFGSEAQPLIGDYNAPYSYDATSHAL